MTRTRPPAWVGAAVTAACLLGPASFALRAETVEDRSRSRPGILVELFTSQGCSSCPPADRYLTELAAREDFDVIPLSFHVDYWNYIGWTDPFSSQDWSERQRRYARLFGGDRVYTPQMVVNGRWEAVGSNRRDISRLLDRASAQPPVAEVSVSAQLLSEERLQVVVNTHRFDPVLNGRRLARWVAIVESDLMTPVGRGENASKTLRNDRVVRRLERLSELEPLEPVARATMEFAVSNDWDRDKLGVVAFLQDADSLSIHAAAEYLLAVPE